MSIEPVRKELVVRASREHAFRVFTEGIDKWWPREHHIGKTPLARAAIEPRPGGRWFSVHVDGSECDTGKVLVWEPPERIVLAWQVTADWRFDPEFVTEVEVRFTALGPKETRVNFEHRNLERYGDKAAGIRNQIGAQGGWPKIFEEFARVAEL